MAFLFFCRGQRAEGMEHGAWSMEHGAWSMEHGAWSMGHGVWGVDDGEAETLAGRMWKCEWVHECANVLMC